MTENIILVEDDDDLRESLLEYLRLEGHQIIAVGTGAEYRQQLAENQFAVAIIDIGLPDACGFDLAEKTSLQNQTKIIILTALSSLDDRVRGYQSGGHLYMTKPVENRELSAAIHSLIKAGQTALSPAVNSEQKANSWVLDNATWLLFAPNQVPTNLTAKELKFLQILLHAEGTLVTRDKIIDALYPRLDSYTTQALAAMVRRLRSKVKKTAGTEFPLQTSYSEGFIFTSHLKAST